MRDFIAVVAYIFFLSHTVWYGARRRLRSFPFAPSSHCAPEIGAPWLTRQTGAVATPPLLPDHQIARTNPKASKMKIKKEKQMFLAHVHG